MKKKIESVEDKMPDGSGLVKRPVFTTKIGKVENKIHDLNGLVKKIVYDAKIQKWRENVSLILIIINLRVIYLMQR